MGPEILAFFDKDTSTITYLVADPATGATAIIDPVLDFDPNSARTATHAADAVIAEVRTRMLHVDWILETHAHADHLSAAAYLKERLGGQVGIGERIVEVQRVFGALFDLGDDFVPDGRQFDRLFGDGERFRLGGLEAEVLYTPGHTPACVSYRIGDAVFIGDTLFMPDSGTARCDFPGGDAALLYRSIRRLLALPPATRLFVCHDYQPGGRPPAWETTVADQGARNIHVGIGEDEASFIRRRMERDAQLDMPRLFLPSVQVNIRAGNLPPPEANGIRYLKLPLNVLGPAAPGSAKP